MLSPRAATSAVADALPPAEPGSSPDSPHPAAIPVSKTAAASPRQPFPTPKRTAVSPSGPLLETGFSFDTGGAL
ncbi:hypothetical protein GCM10010350_23140 [Streptomyces galilaeus]|nr:hypothetical protein GCM10010350_23140 [Streptomyces galilaeus]